MTTDRSDYRYAIERQVEDLKNEGFQVFVEPRDQHLPASLRTLRPDIYATGEGGIVVVEIIGDSARLEQQTDKVLRLKHAVSTIPGAQFRMVDLGQEPIRQKLPRLDPSTILASTEKVRVLVAEGQIAGAFLLSWANFEAAARAMIETDIDRPQLPKSAISKAAREGLLVFEDEEFLKSMVDKRNRLIHGDLTVALDSSEALRLNDIVRSILLPN
jgi:REase_AHJR-like